ncbi:two-component regulator propeller domain-containing protein [Saccharicrinis sp. 156]|uniref:two-component regulator propeller domain-containing protein n=1 Tax=Saccharicrinis sp. 156 TaxID=3417574 RepID=UPI003D343B39
MLLASVILCGLVSMDVLKAQGDVSISSYSIHEGLSGNGITSIFQDSKGFLWVGTQDGLNKYDGYSFKVFRHNLEDSTSISGNHIQCISEDVDGNLWIGTIGNGLNKWDRITGTFTCYNSKLEGAYELPEDNIYGLSFDKDSSLWVKTNNYLLNLKIDPLSKSTYGLYSSIFKYQEKLNIPIFYKNPHILWIGTKDGIAQFNTREKLYERVIVDDEYGTYSNQLGAITGILELSAKSFILAGSQGLYHLNQRDESYSNKKINSLSGKENAINAVIRHSSGSIWLGTKAGLRIAEYSRGKDVLDYNKDSFYNQKQNLITEDEVTFLFEDNSGLLWVGTRYSGLLKVDFKPKKFKRIMRGDKKYSDLNSYDIKSIYIDEQELIWLGTADKGLKILDPERGDVYSYPVNRSLNKIGEDMVLALCRDSKDRIWIGTAKGIYIFYLERGTISEFTYTQSKEVKALLEENRINAIEEDARGNIWFGTQFGLYKYDGNSINNFFAEKGNEESICSDEINDLLLDSEGILWIGTSDGVNFLDSNDDTVKKIGHLRNSGDSISVLSNNYILSIAEDDQDRIWFGTRSGISFYSKKEDVSGFYTHSSGLANDMVYGVICDNNSGVWLSTNKGISLIKANKQIYNFDIADGLPGYVFNVGAVEQSNSGMAYFGGVEGVAFINPDSIHYNLHRPEVVFTSIELFHKGKIKGSFKTDTPQIKLKYRKSSMLKVRFAALEFSESAKNKYQVYLEGFDDDWRPVTSENTLDISDLPAGDYTLHVKGANSDHIWTEKPVTLDISVVPPIWMSSYAYAFYLIALVFLIQSIINFRIRNYKSAYKSLEEKAGDKKKIEAQRELLSKINQSLTDSIYYAKRIQESILPSELEIKKVLPESFVYYRPKDLVSGDFYWKHEINGKIFIAAVDCTGHGVPGAFMSIIAYDMLKGIINSKIEHCPAYILERLNKEVINTFKKNSSAERSDTLSVNDGMDIALCIIDKSERKLSFAGAYNPLYLIRDNEMFVYKGNRFPIGYNGEKEMRFSKHEIALEENDVFYIFSDGYADQFGGDEGKKFKYRRFRHLLLNIHRLPAEDQKAILHQKIEEWMGNFEQLDDMIVMGIKPLEE